MTPLLLTLLACGGNDTTIGAGGNEISTVPEDASMSLSVPGLTWTDVALGFSNSQPITITSDGEGALQVTEVKLVTNPQAAFYFDEVEDIQLEPTQEATYSVVVNLDAGWDLATYAEGTLRIKTNDVECVEVLLPLLAFPEGFTGTAPAADTAETEILACL